MNDVLIFYNNLNYYNKVVNNKKVPISSVVKVSKKLLKNGVNIKSKQTALIFVIRDALKIRNVPHRTSVLCGRYLAKNLYRSVYVKNKKAKDPIHFISKKIDPSKVFLAREIYFKLLICCLNDFKKIGDWYE